MLNGYINLISTIHELDIYYSFHFTKYLKTESVFGENVSLPDSKLFSKPLS